MLYILVFTRDFLSFDCCMRFCVAYPWDKAMREPEDWDKWHVWIPRFFVYIFLIT